MCAPDYIRDVVVPTVGKGREKAGKTLAGFEIEAAVPVCLTSSRQAGLDGFREVATRYASLPFYRKALDRTFPDMSDSPNDQILATLAGIGDIDEVRATIERYRDAGTTLPVIGPFGGHDGAAGFEALPEFWVADAPAPLVVVGATRTTVAAGGTPPEHPARVSESSAATATPRIAVM